jgi:hypothetical protein
MAHEAPAAGTPRITPAIATTKRGFATASFSLGLWGLMVFWWYPFGMTIAGMGVLFGVVTLALGIRAGKDGENLALLGIFLGSTSISFAIGAYRFMQLAFEGTFTRPVITPEADVAAFCIATLVAIAALTATLMNLYRISRSRAGHAQPADTH